MKTVNVDVLVCGGGMSGMACAAFASAAGAKVLLVEKQSEVGGSSNYSAGMFWAPKNFASMREWVADGDPNLQQAWLQDYLPAVQWMRENGVPTSSRFGPIMTIGIGYPIKIKSLHNHHKQRISSSKTESEILLNSQVVKLIQEQPCLPGSSVTGAIIRTKSSQQDAPSYVLVNAKQVVLATGGFQGSSELRSTHLGPGGSDIFVRANAGSVGDGLTLATTVGAGLSRGLDTFYGHLMAAPVRKEDVSPSDYLPLAQYQSKYCILINEDGKRFVDETLGDEVVNQCLAKERGRRGFILFDEKSRAEHCVSALFPNAGDIDRLEKARSYGCNVASADTLDQLCTILESWGVNGPQAKQTMDQYLKAVGQGDSATILEASVGKIGQPPRPLVEGQGPFYAMEVQPSITFTYGGVSIDTDGQALTPDRKPINGLLVAGVDAGGFSNVTYAGGLALAFVTGFWAARTATRALNLQEPKLPLPNPEDMEKEERSVVMRSQL
ncbi:unnamed protein product [Clonostachys rhizophaga]|uniref:FAD-dependent oxidoreductase 2 FAD-binding domain-containing protein n=1 Tax=Clonostachys rhizophaga TaxID=160324 RepID=A0A9N9VCG8_9HYPO|nr:unnamed protein product [Clonostachys rhizophaga]